MRVNPLSRSTIVASPTPRRSVSSGGSPRRRQRHPANTIRFGGTTFLLSMYNVQARHITHPNVILGMALGYGGLVQLIAGIEEWACGNTFAATAFSSYGGFWISFATLYIPQFEVTGGSTESGIFADPVAAYPIASELDGALGIYLATWG